MVIEIKNKVYVGNSFLVSHISKVVSNQILTKCNIKAKWTSEKEVKEKLSFVKKNTKNIWISREDSFLLNAIEI